MKRLAKESLNFAGSHNRQLIFGAQFIHAEDCDDVLQIAIALQHSLNASRDIVMIFADDLRSE